MAADRPPPKIMITVEERSGRDDAGGMMPSVLPLTGRRTMRAARGKAFFTFIGGKKSYVDRSCRIIAIYFSVVKVPRVIVAAENDEQRFINQRQTSIMRVDGQCCRG